ncbi:sperm-associated antigen 7 homolog [Watersipora subatra]|uniref:sperm-associated antigen 7 homolog n=1 Tax=Watersipora subatra TaxID=2589382 RepID=UPI00355C5853
MDLLGSIMNSMDKPPITSTDAERKRVKERKLQMEKWKQHEDKRILAFRAKMKARIESFIRDADAGKLKFEPMQSVDRSIIREITDDAGLVAFSFGEEEVDRHVIVWKKESAPSDDELAVLRSGGEWSEEKSLEIKQKREMEKERRIPSKAGPAPKTNYQMKYSHLVSMEVGKTGAQDISVNKQYGNVKLENKQDRRTIEETLAERKAKRMRESIDTELANDNQTKGTLANEKAS